MVNKELIVRGDKELALYELETRFAMAVRQRQLLENYIKERLKPDKHFYTVGDEPGRKPSLTKEGAELICLPHDLKGHYEWLSGPETPPLDDTPYQITMKCELETTSGKFEGEGVGSASSMITKKTGERVQRQKDPGLRHNATIKMACKSAYIAATLNSTAASEFFTQDLEDDQTDEVTNSQSKEHWCKLHNTAFFMKGKMKSYAHPIEGTEPVEWCHEHKEKPSATKKQAEEQAAELEDKLGEQIAEDMGKQAKTDPSSDGGIDMEWVRQSMKELRWSEETVKSFLANSSPFKVSKQGTLTEVIGRLNKEQQAAFCKEIQERLDMR